MAKTKPAPITPTELRTRLYRVLEQVERTGVPQEIRRGKNKLWIVREERPRRRPLAGLPKRNALNCTVDELVATTWEWEPDGNL
jgi:hypothetical protein